MATRVGEVAERISTVFNLSKAAGWDPVGLQFGDPAAHVGRVAVCHEVTPAVADRLVAEDVDLVVTYHPLLFRPTRRLIAGNSAAGLAYRLIAAGTSLLTVHTAFDVLPGGTADSLAQALGLQKPIGFGPAWGSESAKVITFVPASAADSLVAAMGEAGAGDIGNYSHCSFRSAGTGTFFASEDTTPATGAIGALNSEPETRVEMVAPLGRVDAVVSALVRHHPYEEPAYDVIKTRGNAGFVGRSGTLGEPLALNELADLVHTRLGGVVRVAGSGEVVEVAVIPGSGGSMLGVVDADVVVTGDVSHHQARDALARGLKVIDPGHAATERPGVQALYAGVVEIAGSALDLTDFDSDPWKER